MKKRISLLLLICLVTTIISGEELLASNTLDSSNVNVELMTSEQIDAFFEKANVPEQKIEELDDELKKFIISNSGTNIEYVEVIREEIVAPRANGYTISTTELSLSVVVFKSGNQLEIYPTYEWLTPTKPKGKDYFGYAVSSSYSAVPNERSNRIWYKLDVDDAWTVSGSATYTGSSIYGYEHSGSSLGSPDFKLYLKGCFYYKVDIDSSNPVKKIAMSYVHDKSWFSSVSYGVSYGPASISITPSSSNVGYQNGVFWLNY